MKRPKAPQAKPAAPIPIDAAARVDAARAAVCAAAPWLASAAWALRGPYWRPGIATAGVSGDGRLYVDPQLAEEWEPGALAALLEHEVWHPVLQHAPRARVQGVEAREQRRANVAADCEIHSGHLRAAALAALDEAAGRDGGRSCTPERFGLPPGRSFEEYLQALREKGAEPEAGDEPEGAGGGGSAGAGASGGGGESDSQSPSGQSASDPGGDAADGSGSSPASGSAADGIRRSWEEPMEGDPEASGWSPAEKAAIQRGVAEGVQAASAAGRSDLPAGLERWAADQLRPPRVDWRARLRRLAQAAVSRAGAADYTYSRPSRRDAGASRGYVSPGLHAPQVEVAVVVDTSGSMTEDDLRDALSEVVGVVQAVGARVQVAACDAQATRFRPVRRVEDVRLIGGGGTDMRVGITAAARLRPRPAACIVLTDGDTPWPESRPRGLRVIATIVGGRGTEAPDWIDVVEVEVER